MNGFVIILTADFENTKLVFLWYEGVIIIILHRDIQYFSTTYLSWVFEKAKQVPTSPNKNGQVPLLLFFNCSILL